MLTEAEIEKMEERRYEIDKELSRLRDEAIAADPKVLYDQERWGAIGEHLADEYCEIGRYLRMNRPPRFEPIPDYGEVMTLADFIKRVEGGWFIDYDGYGHYVREGQDSRIEIYPSDVKNKAVRTDFDTIIWFNR